MTMRLFLAFGGAVATVLAVFACSDSDAGGGASSGGPFVPEGGMILEDGAVVGPDGEIIPQGDSAIPSKVNLTTENVTVLGNARVFVLAVPKTYDAARKYPLIIAIHGDGQTGASLVPFLGFDAINGDEAIVAYPTIGGGDLFTPYDQNPDQQLIEVTINAVKAKLSIDDAKVWGFGYSKGGFLANEIGCRKPGILKAIAAHAAGAPQEPQDGNFFPICPGVVGQPMLVTEGTNDTGIGGEHSARYWASVNGCGTGRSPTTPAECQKFDGCPAEKTVTYCLAPGVSHYPIWSQAAAISWNWFKSL